MVGKIFYVLSNPSKPGSIYLVNEVQDNMLSSPGYIYIYLHIYFPLKKIPNTRIYTFHKGNIAEQHCVDLILSNLIPRWMYVTKRDQYIHLAE